MDIEKKHQLVAQRLLTLVSGFLADLDSERALQNISLAASLERDLGIDSIGQVELFSRVEKTFSVQLGESALVEVESFK